MVSKITEGYVYFFESCEKQLLSIAFQIRDDQGVVTLLRDNNHTRFELFGAMAGILALLLSPMGWIHVVGKKSFHSFAFLILLIIIVSTIPLFFLVV